MTFLPIVQRELRAAARARGTHWTRVLSVLVALTVAGWMLLVEQRMAAPILVGNSLFRALGKCAFVYCLLIGVRNTADCLSSERREGTLGLLFLTDLRGFDIVLGKMAATSLNSFYGLLAFLPIMAIPLLLGGLQAAQVGRVALVLMNTLLFSLACGIFVSTLCQSDRKAVWGSAALLLLFTGGLPLTDVILAESGPPPRTPSPLLLWPSPGYTMSQAFNLKGGAEFWNSLVFVHLMSWTFVLAASFYLRRVWQDKSVGAKPSRRRATWCALAQGDPAIRRAFRTRLLNVNPCYWLFARDRSQSRLVWLVLVAAGIIWLWGYWKLRQDWLDKGVFVITALVVHSILKLWIASQAGHALVQDRANGALELLLCTAVNPRHIVRGQRQALQRQFGLPILVVLVVDGLFLLDDAYDSQWVVVCLAGMAMLLIDAVTLHYVGAWAGMTAKRSTRAMGSAVGRVLVLPWIVFYVIWVSASVIAAARRAVPGLAADPQGVVLLWFLIGVANNAVFGLIAWQNLRTRFRAAAAERYAGRIEGSLFQRAGRAFGRWRYGLARSVP